MVVMRGDESGCYDVVELRQLMAVICVWAHDGPIRLQIHKSPVESTLIDRAVH